MNSYSKPNHGQDIGSTSSPDTFQRPVRNDATRSSINQASYDPHNPGKELRFKREFNSSDSMPSSDDSNYHRG